jgi:hypothetical protein
MDVSPPLTRRKPLISVSRLLHQGNQTRDRDELVLQSLLAYRAFSLVSTPYENLADE